MGKLPRWSPLSPHPTAKSSLEMGPRERWPSPAVHGLPSWTGSQPPGQDQAGSGSAPRWKGTPLPVHPVPGCPPQPDALPSPGALSALAGLRFTLLIHRDTPERLLGSPNSYLPASLPGSAWVANGQASSRWEG